MQQKTLAVVLAVFATFLTPAAGASAAPFTPQLDLAYKLAIEYWGREPSQCGSIALEVAPAISLEEGEGEVWGRATEPRPMDQDISCSLAISDALTSRISWEAACPTVAHEVGHLLGYDHSPDPGSIMYPSFVDGVNTPQCENAEAWWVRIVTIRSNRNEHVEICRAVERRKCWQRARRERHRTGSELRAAIQHFWAPLAA